MVKLFQTVLIVGVLAVATPAKLDKIRSTKNRFLARQEVAEDIPAQTPYPPAGVRPEVPFDLPTEEKLVAPANHYLPPSTDPAMFYSAPAEVYGPPAEVYGPPAETYGPPDFSENDDDKSAESAAKDEESQTEAASTEESVTEEVKSTEEPQEPSELETDVEPSPTEEDNVIPERLVLNKSRNAVKAAKLRQFAPLTRKTVPAKQFYLINGSLYTLA